MSDQQLVEWLQSVKYQRQQAEIAYNSFGKSQLQKKYLTGSLNGCDSLIDRIVKELTKRGVQLDDDA
jgi:hypothetical protein